MHYSDNMTGRSRTTSWCLCVPYQKLGLHTLDVWLAGSLVEKGF